MNFWSGTTLDGEKVAVVLDITEEMIDRAAAAYVFGVMPGDESEATDEEIRAMAERVLRAALEASPRPSEESSSAHDADTAHQPAS